MTKGRKIGIGIIWLVVVGVIAIMAMEVNDVCSMAQYYDERRSQFVDEFEAVTKLAQVFELPKLSFVSYRKNELTAVLSDCWRDTTAGAFATASFQIEGENVTLIKCTTSNETSGVISIFIAGSVLSIFIGMLLTYKVKNKKSKKV